MDLIRMLCFLIGLPIYLFSLILLLVSITGFGWGKGHLNFATLILVGIAIFNAFLFAKIAKTGSKKVLLISVIFLIISIIFSVLLPLSN